jgi:DNA-binding MarR family transcriptional regulator
MDEIDNPSDEQLRAVVATFWESFPPFWQRIRAHIRQVTAEQYEISVEQFHILRHIRRGHHSVSELAEAKQISRAAVSQALNALVAKGLVARQANPQDRRYVRLTLTPAGEALLDAVFESARQRMVEILAPPSTAELDALQRGLESLKKTGQG